MSKKGKTLLTELEVFEVSLVDKGAIGESFTVIKSEDPESKEGINLVNKIDICEKLENMNDAEFVKIMGQMMNRYNSINKGGSKMNPDEIKSLVAEIVDSAMETVNKNFVAVNKTIDELQKKAKSDSIEEEEEEKKKKEMQTSEEGEVAKAVNAIGDAVKKLSEAVGTITTSLEGVTSQVTKLSELKLDETLADVNKRLEAMEQAENPSNNAANGQEVDVNKGKKKEVFWKSFLEPQE